MGHSAVRIDSKYPCRVPPAVSRGQSHGTGREGWASCLLPLSPQQDGFKLETQGLPSRTQAQDVRIEPPSSEDRPLLLPHLCGSNKGSLTNFTHPSRAPSHPPRQSGGLQTTLEEQPACCHHQGPFHMPCPRPQLERGSLDSTPRQPGVGEVDCSPAPSRYNYKIKFYNLYYGSKSPWLAVSSRCQAPWHS